jgi:heme exporter protein A
MANAVLEAVELECLRGERRLFRGLSFVAEPASLLWVVGANGTGKTSLLRILSTLLPPESGEVRWRGENARAQREAFRAELLYLGHAAAVKDDLTALENLDFALRQHGVDASERQVLDALEEFGLAGLEGLPVRALSQGQKRRVALARLALGQSKPLWVLDEPFNALDAVAVSLVRRRLAGQLERGGVVVLTSHQDVDLAGLRVQRLALDA